jgi:hypothetical protein
MSAKRYDSPLRWHVDSHTRTGIKHLVELDAYDGNGRCSCENFTYRLEKVIAQPGATPSNSTRCSHILEARDECLDQVLKLVKARQKENGHDKKEKAAA